MSDTLTILTPEKSWRAPFLEALRMHGVVTQAASAAGVSRWTVYHERNTDELFAKEWNEALALGVDALEDAAKMRAFQGSDTMLIFLLKSHRPEKYRETVRTVTLNITPEDLQNLSDDDLDNIERQLKASHSR